MNLEFMILANYAEANNNLLYIQGGGWDTITMGAPLGDLPGLPPGASVFAVLQGTLVIRLNFHQTEAGSDYSFALRIIDEDGNEVGKAEGPFRVDPQPGVPPTWPINVQIA